VAADNIDILSNDIVGNDYIIIVDPTLNLTEIVKNADKNTIIIVNSKENIPALKKALGKKHYIDATKIAMEHLKRNQPNTVLLGAVIKLSNKITIKNAKRAIELEIDDKVKENMESLEIGIKSVK
jgi:pyruvate ferredoxin oxidoreductase gamma subunit